MIRPRRAVAALVALAAIGALAACGPDSASSAKAGTCLDATAHAAPPTSTSTGISPGPAASASPGGAAPSTTGSAASVGSKLPAVSLACFDGTGDVKLTALGRPAVVNLWAAWCGPCRVELPGIQQFAQSGTVTVIGVDTADTHSGAAPVIDDLGLTYPMVADPDKKLANAVGLSVLPITLFVDAQGTVRYVYVSGTPLTKESLTRLVAENLGVGG